MLFERRRGGKLRRSCRKQRLMRALLAPLPGRPLPGRGRTFRVSARERQKLDSRVSSSSALNLRTLARLRAGHSDSLTEKYGVRRLEPHLQNYDRLGFAKKECFDIKSGCRQNRG